MTRELTNFELDTYNAVLDAIYDSGDCSRETAHQFTEQVMQEIREAFHRHVIRVSDDR